MALPRLSNLEMKVLEVVWAHGPSSLREIQEKLPGKKRPAYTTVQTIVGRLEIKKAIRKAGTAGAAHLFAATVSRDAARHRLIDDFLAIFGGETKPVMTHLVTAGKLTLEDVDDVRRHLEEILKKDAKP
jgi:BlaI family penicillinase repressor